MSNNQEKSFRKLPLMLAHLSNSAWKKAFLTAANEFSNLKTKKSALLQLLVMKCCQEMRLMTQIKVDKGALSTAEKETS